MIQLLSQFKKTFVKAIELEMEALKKRLGSFEIRVFYDSAVHQSDRKKDLHLFDIKTSADKLSPGMQCTLSFKNSDYAAEIFSINNGKCEIYIDSNIKISPEDEAVIVVYPWFLYEKLIAGINGLEHITPGLELAFSAFGKSKTPVLKNSVPVSGELSEVFNSLNKSQKDAVRYSLDSSVSFIWGPPGTGKTYTLSVLLAFLLKQNLKILAVSTTNGAIDTVISQLSDLKICDKYFDTGKIVRFGREHEAENRVNISNILSSINSSLFRQLDEYTEAAYLLEEELSALNAILGGLNKNDNQLDLFASKTVQKKPESLSSISPELYKRWPDIETGVQIKETTALLEKKRNVLNPLKQKIDALQKALIKNPRAALDNANLVFSTIAGLYSGDMLSNLSFDIVIIEEAGMAVLPALFYSISKADKKVILVGDPMQLPPIIYSDNPYVVQAMGRSIYQVGLDDGYRGDHVHLLDTQYRMHPEIGRMISTLFYDNRLENGMEKKEREHITTGSPFPDKSIVLYDMQNKSVCRHSEASYSRFNELSAQACIDFLKEISPGFSIGIITPYVAQTNLIKKYILNSGFNKMDIECSTVHRFQGKEKDIIILDLTDAEPLPPGILTNGKDAPNLLNVAMSRAKGKLIVIAERDYFLNKAGHSKLSEVLEFMTC